MGKLAARNWSPDISLVMSSLLFLYSFRKSYYLNTEIPGPAHQCMHFSLSYLLFTFWAIPSASGHSEELFVSAIMLLTCKSLCWVCKCSFSCILSNADGVLMTALSSSLLLVGFLSLPSFPCPFVCLGPTFHIRN